MLEFQSILGAITVENPAGEDISPDSDFAVFQASYEIKPEIQIGDSTKAAEEPDWNKVYAACIELSGRGKHLEVGLALTLSATMLKGFKGFAAGLDLLNSWLENFFDELYPRADVSEREVDEVYSERLSLLVNLSIPPYKDGDHFKFIERLSSIAITDSRMAGSFGFKEIKKARDDGSIPPEQLAAAFNSSDPDALASKLDALRSAQKSVIDLESVFERKLGAAGLLNFSILKNLLAEIISVIAENSGTEAVGNEIREESTEKNYPASAPNGDSAVALGVVRNRADALRQIDSIIAYFEKNEPSSPVPDMLRRCKKMVGAGFMDILRNLSPESISTAEMIMGLNKQNEQ